MLLVKTKWSRERKTYRKALKGLAQRRTWKDALKPMTWMFFFHIVSHLKHLGRHESMSGRQLMLETRPALCFSLIYSSCDTNRQLETIPPSKVRLSFFRSRGFLPSWKSYAILDLCFDKLIHSGKLVDLLIVLRKFSITLNSFRILEGPMLWNEASADFIRGIQTIRNGICFEPRHVHSQNRNEPSNDWRHVGYYPDTAQHCGRWRLTPRLSGNTRKNYFERSSWLKLRRTHRW